MTTKQVKTGQEKSEAKRRLLAIERRERARKDQADIQEALAELETVQFRVWTRGTRGEVLGF